MLHDNVRAWLTGSQNFIVGRALYKQIGRDDNIKQQLLKGENAGTVVLLREAMQALLEQPAPKAITGDSQASEMPASDDTVLKALREEWLPLYARMNYLRAAIDQYGESNAPEVVAAREPLAFEILQLEEQCEQIWLKRSHYLKHGSLPELKQEEFAIPEDPRELAKLLQNIPRNIRRNRNKMGKPGADAIYAQLYVRYKELYKQITGKDYHEKQTGTP